MNQDKPKKNRGRGLFVVLIILLLAVLAAAVYFMITKTRENRAIQAQEASEETVFSVNTTFSRRGELREYLNINGDIVATETVDVYPDTSGRLSRLAVSLGSPVRKDQGVARVDPSRPGMNYSESPVKSPIAGTVTAIYGQIGAMATVQMPLLSVGDLSSLKVRTDIPERFTSQVSIGQQAFLNFETFPDKTFEARVSEISPVVNPVSRSMQVKMNIVSPLEDIKAGMYANIDLILQVKPSVIRVASACVVNRFEKDYVFVVQGDRVKMRPVVPGITQDGITEILEGLEADTEVVFQGVIQLEDGSKISVVSQLETL